MVSSFAFRLVLFCYVPIPVGNNAYGNIITCTVIFIFSGMTISHRGTRSRSSNTSSARENTATENTSSHIETDDAPGVAINPNEVFLRGSADLPPVILNQQDHPLLLKSGKM